MQYLPINIRIENRPVLVVGGGVVAARKIALLARTGANITVVAPEAVETIRDAHADERLRWITREFKDGDLDSAVLAFAATDNKHLQERVSAAARRRHIPVNVVDNRRACDFIMPAIVDRDPVLVSISSGGASPVLARRLRERIEALLPQAMGRTAKFLERQRETIAAAIPEIGARRRFIESIVDGPVAASLAAGDETEARTRFREALNSERGTRGLVSLVGAGPGDPELLTLKALRCLQQADTIVHDGLVDERILELARRDAEFVSAAKRRGEKRITQDDINRLLRDRALKGENVVRLKGGDPFVFGRGGEELEYLKRWRVPFEVVPGITAAAGCAAYAGIPLTHREHANTLTLVTAHSRDSVDHLDWTHLVRSRQTLGVYMGVGTLPELESKLIAHGRNPETPVAFVENGTRPEQRVIAGHLQGMADLAKEFELNSPALVFIGETAALAKELAWFGTAPIEVTPPPGARRALGGGREGVQALVGPPSNSPLLLARQGGGQSIQSKSVTP